MYFYSINGRFIGVDLEGENERGLGYFGEFLKVNKDSSMNHWHGFVMGAQNMQSRLGKGKLKMRHHHGFQLQLIGLLIACIAQCCILWTHSG